MGLARYFAKYSNTSLVANVMSPAQPQLDRLHRAGDIDDLSLIVLYEGKIELMRQMTRKTSRILAEELLPRTHLRTVCILFHLLVSMAPVLSHAVHANSNSL